MKQKPKRKSSSFVDRLFTKRYQFYTPLPLDKVVECLHDMSGVYKQLVVYLSRIIVNSESQGDGYVLTIEVTDNRGNSVVSYFEGRAYTVDDGGTQVRGFIRVNTHLLGISLTLITIAGFITWLANDAALRVFMLVIFMGSPVYLLVNLFIKRHLLINQLDSTLAQLEDDHSQAKSKPLPTE